MGLTAQIRIILILLFSFITNYTEAQHKIDKDVTFSFKGKNNYAVLNSFLGNFKLDEITAEDCTSTSGIIKLISLSASAQERWIIKSQYLQQADTVLIFKLKSYNGLDKKPLVYLLHGYSENYRQWPKIADLQNLADRYGFFIVAPDGFQTYYINSAVNKSAQFEDFFFNDLVPKLHSSFRIDEKNIFISGLSMGGYGALRLLINNSIYFNTGGSSSGALEIDHQKLNKASRHFWGTDVMTDTMAVNLGNPQTADWNSLSITELIKSSGFRGPFIFDCGTQDILYRASENLKNMADALQIPAVFISGPGGHASDY